MDRDSIIKKLSKYQEELEFRFGVASISLFGSNVRNDAISTSDIDLLVTFSNPPGIFGFLKLKEYLENLFNCPVDLVTKNALKTSLRQQIIEESVHAF